MKIETEWTTKVQYHHNCATLLYHPKTNLLLLVRKSDEQCQSKPKKEAITRFGGGHNNCLTEYLLEGFDSEELYILLSISLVLIFVPQL